jgi:hypothetical protein
MRQEKRRREKEQAAQERKGEALMRSSLRRATTTMILLALFLAPGFLQARTSAWERASVARPAAEWGFFNMVWDLLTDIYESGVGISPNHSGFNKNGGMVDPSGGTAPPVTGGGATTNGDNGGMVDPSGGKG